MAPNRSLIIEFYTSRLHDDQQYYQFQVIFFENVPGLVRYQYFHATDACQSCTIGVEGMMK